MQIACSCKRYMARYPTRPGSQLVLCSTDPIAFRDNLRAHVATMAPLGFNAYALGLLAARDIALFVGSPQALAAHFVMLRSFFYPWGDELADDVRLTNITSLCLPAVAQNAIRAAHEISTSTGIAQISRLHKAMLAGPHATLTFTRESLERHTRTLTVAGLCASTMDAKRECMLRLKLLFSRKLEWYLWRKAAVLEAGGSLADVRAACCRTARLCKVLQCLLLWQRAR